MVVNLDDTIYGSCSNALFGIEGRWHVVWPIFIFSFNNLALIKLASSNKWTWSYKPSNWVRLDKTERNVSSLPTLSGLRWRWHQNCFNKASKMVNLVSHDFVTYCTKPMIVLCDHTLDFFNGFLSRVGHISLKIIQLETTFWSLSLTKSSKSLKPCLLQNQQSKLPTVKIIQNPHHFDQRVKY